MDVEQKYYQVGIRYEDQLLIQNKYVHIGMPTGRRQENK